MKQFVFLIMVFVCSTSFGQTKTWRDEVSSARAAYKKGEYTKALKHYESAQKTIPENIDLSDEMGQTAYKAREFERAEKIYQQSASSEDDAAKKTSRLKNLGHSRMKQKNYQGAIDAYKEALRKNPTDEKTRYNLSEAIRKLKEEEKKNPPQQNQQQNQQCQNPNNGQQNPNQGGQQQQQNQQGKQNQQSQQGQSGQKKQNESQGGGNPSQQGAGQLPNKMVDRELDKLARREAETKQRMSGGNGAGKPSKSGKDW